MREPQPSPANVLTDNQSPTCTNTTTMAERELAAFISAVTELFGSERARPSTRDWLHELALMNSPLSLAKMP